MAPNADASWVTLRSKFHVTKFFQACTGMIDTSHALNMGQVMAAWDRVGLKAEEAAKNKNSTAGTIPS